MKIWFMLVHRLMLFGVFQGIFALAFAVGGHDQPWEQSIGWWPIAALLTNLISISLLVSLARQEGHRYRDYLNYDRSTTGRDLVWFLATALASGLAAFVPNVMLGTALFGDPEATVAMMFRPLPIWAAWLSILFALTIGAAELPTYFGYVMPRLEAKTHSGWSTVLLPAVFLSLQHITLPLIFNIRFVIWRGLMFLPFALLLAFVLRRRPGLLVYLMVFHVLLDLTTAVMVIQMGI